MQYKKVKEYLDPNSGVIELNSYAAKILDENGLCIEHLESHELYKYLVEYLNQEVLIEPSSGCYVFKKHYHFFTPLYTDKTANEFSNNKIFISAYRKNFRTVLCISLSFLFLLSKKLSALKVPFYTYWIYNEIMDKEDKKLEEFIISFHAIRNGEDGWCDDNLDLYCTNNRLFGKEAIIRIKHGD